MSSDFLRRIARSVRCAATAVGTWTSVAWAQSSSTSWSVIFDDPTGQLTPFEQSIESNLLSAADDWSSSLIGLGNIEVQVSLGNVPRATGRSISSSYTGTEGGFNIYEQGAAAEIRTGIDPNGSGPDVEIVFGLDYLTSELWFDPQPQFRTDPVPALRTDAYSVLLHELGHALAFNGWADPFNASLPSNYASTWDRWLTFDGANIFFEGPSAMSVYGGPIPVTFGNPSHIGNPLTRPGFDLVGDLMNGVVFSRGSRYNISPLDWAVLDDAGLPVIPAPGTVAVCVVGIPILRRRRAA